MVTAPDVVRLRDGHVRLLCAPTSTVRSAAAFRPEHWPESRAAGGGRGNAWFVSDEQQTLVLRHYLRGGKAALVSRDRYLFAGLERTRSFREFQLLYELHAAGLPVPEPVAALVDRRGLTYRAALITRAIDGAASLGERIGRQCVRAEHMAAVGHCVRRFHDAGVWHADLNANNVLFDADDNVHLIDFDRGRRRGGSGWHRNTLARLQRSLNKLSRRASDRPFEASLWEAFVTAYRKRQARL